MVHGHVTRPYSHSLSDDERLYRPDTEREKDAKRDPVTRLQMFLVRENILDEAGVNKLEKSVDQEVEAAADQALKAALPTTDRFTGTFILRTLIRAKWPASRSHKAATRPWPT